MPSYSPFVQPVVDAAMHRGMRVRPLPELSPSWVQIDFRGHRELICQSFSDRVGSATFRVLSSRAGSIRFLTDMGHPVARSLVVHSAQQAEAFREEHGSLTLKPLAHPSGPRTTTHIGWGRVEEAYERATDSKGRALAQEHLDGEAVRVLVVGERVFGLQRTPAEIEGDGARTIRQLIGTHNASLAVRHHSVRIDSVLRAHLERRGYTLDSTIPKGARVRLSDLANTSRGGFCHDVTDLLAPETLELGRAIARGFGVEVVTVELMSEDLVHRPGKITELMPFTDLSRFHHPTTGKGRDVAGAWLDVLFPGSRG